MNRAPNDLLKVIETAKKRGFAYFDHFTIPQFNSRDEAIEYRELIVPILYKLGMTMEASQLAQATFEYLFLEIHLEVESRIKEILGENIYQRCQDILPDYFCDEGKVTYRIKSTHSIWKKEFVLKDFLGIRWEMPILSGQNRLDALINGLRLAPKKFLQTFRNQHLDQNSGFDREPVMKLCYLHDEIPVELQILGGSISAYLCGKGYARYKIKLPLPPGREELGEEMWNCRLGMLIHSESRFEMFQELIGEKVDYVKYDPFYLDDEPQEIRNKEFRFPGSSTPAYQLHGFSI